METRRTDTMHLLEDDLVLHYYGELTGQSEPMREVYRLALEGVKS